VGRLCQTLEARDIREWTAADGKKISLDYIKRHGKKDEPVKAAWGGARTLRDRAKLEDLRLEPVFICCGCPMFAKILADWESFARGSRRVHCPADEKLRRLPLLRADGQDRPAEARLYRSLRTEKVPLLPGFNFNWRKVDQALCDNILAALDAVD
jgi:hypothetical protein